MSKTFVAIDVETANASRASICQIGLVASDGENELWRWSSLVDPQESFEKKFVDDMHHIHPRQVLAAPLFPDVLRAIGASLDGQCIASWSEFDQDAISQACTKYRIESKPSVFWLDACDVARHVWPDLPNHKLITVAAALGLDFDHHDALADAWACAQIVNAALEISGTTIDDWLERFGQRIAAPYSGPAEISYELDFALDGNPDGPLYGHVLLATGEFAGGKHIFSRRAAELGCATRTSFSGKVTLLVVGHRDPARYDGVEKSEKQLKAEQAQREGQSVAILTEQQFMDWVAQLEQQQRTA